MSVSKDRESVEKEYGVKEAMRDAEIAIMRYEENAGKDELTLAREAINAREQLQLERYRNDVRKVIAMPEGRRIFWRLLEVARFFSLSFSKDNDSTNFNEGSRYVGLKILGMIYDADPGAFGQIQREHESDMKSRKEKDLKENQ